MILKEIVASIITIIVDKHNWRIKCQREFVKEQGIIDKISNLDLQRDKRNGESHINNRYMVFARVRRVARKLAQPQLSDSIQHSSGHVKCSCNLMPR